MEIKYKNKKMKAKTAKQNGICTVCMDCKFY